MKRRKFIYISSAAISGLVFSGAVNSCISRYNPSKINRIWTDKFDLTTKDKIKKIFQIVRCGVLAPSTYNNQPWLFKISDDSIEIIPDFSRSLKFADSQHRELFISIGCCLENILIASQAFGFDANYKISNNNDNIIINLKQSDSNLSPENTLFGMITERRTTRTEYDKVPVPDAIIHSLIPENQPQTKLLYQESLDAFRKMLEYEKEANRLLFGNKNYSEELQNWTRFSDNEAGSKLDGLYSRSMGDAATTEWLGNMYFDLWVTPETQNKQDEKLINSASALMLLFGEDTASDWITSGRELQKLLLRITATGLKYSFICKSCRIEVLRKDIASEFQHRGLLPQTALRLGYSDSLPRSLRRAVKDVIIK